MDIISSPVENLGWGMTFIYNVKSGDTEEILRILSSEGAGTEETEKARRLLNDAQYNSAITYTNRLTRKTVMILTDTTAQNEFVNSLVHEMLHLSRHIADCGNSETLCNSLGNLSGQIFRSVFNA